MNQDWDREPGMDAHRHVKYGDGYITKNPINMTKTDRDSLFTELDSHLQKQKLPTSYGLHRLAHADEFMLMHISEDGTIGFKHICSRNYVFLVPKYRHEGCYELSVPISNEPFMRGQFDE